MKAKITNQMFQVVKTLSKGGATVKEISEYLKLGTSTITRIRAAETYEEYKQICAASAINAKKKAEKVASEAEPQDVQATEPAPAPKPSASDYYKDVRVYAELARHGAELRQLNETMKLISNKLAFIVDQLV